MMTIISLLLLASLLPHPTFTADVNVGIVHGKVAYSRPYMVSIQLKEHICGGFLISDQWVLTAAHCWVSSCIRCQDLTVVVGTLDLGKINILNRITVKDCIPHPGYTSRPYRNDIMLLQLSRNVHLNNHVQWISLPKKNVVASNLNCSVAGWGRLSSNGPPSTHLMEANVFIKNHLVCQQRWGNEYIDSQMICVDGSGGSCEGDSGGPLVCGNTAVGITSFGDICHCNSPKHPNVYTKISAHLPWIQQTIRNVK